MKHKWTQGNLGTFHCGTFSLQHILWFHSPEMSIIQMILNHHKTFTKHQALKSSSLADHKRTELTKTHLQIPLCCTPGLGNYLHFGTEQRD